MKCDDLARRLSDLRDGALEESDCAAIEKHLTECSDCGSLHRDFEDLARLCRESVRPRMPLAVRRRIEDALSRG
jgi:predicted anti-sigma-YlaC factor YlaD